MAQTHLQLRIEGILFDTKKLNEEQLKLQLLRYSKNQSELLLVVPSLAGQEGWRAFQLVSTDSAWDMLPHQGLNPADWQAIYKKFVSQDTNTGLVFRCHWHGQE